MILAQTIRPLYVRNFHQITDIYKNEFVVI